MIFFILKYFWSRPGFLKYFCKKNFRDEIGDFDSLGDNEESQHGFSKNPPFLRRK
jgi:hypothetical protein